jgi:hypothetical protein
MILLYSCAVFLLWLSRYVPVGFSLMLLKVRPWHLNLSIFLLLNLQNGITLCSGVGDNPDLTSGETEAARGGEKGWAKGDHLNVKSNIAGVGALGTLVHEIAHSLMHFKESSPFFIQTDKPLSSEEKELQAESVSYVVLKHYDLPVQHHSTYLAIWRADKDSLSKSLKDIKNVSAYIIQGMDKIAKESESNEPSTTPTA